MTDYTPTPGDTVQVTFTAAVVTDIYGTVGLVVNGMYYPVPTNATLQLVTDPEPDWRPGDLVRDGEGFTAVRRAASALSQWLRLYADGSIAMLSDADLPRPLILLVRNGEASGA